MLTEIPAVIGNFTSSPCGMAEFVGEVQQRKIGRTVGATSAEWALHVHVVAGRFTPGDFRRVIGLSRRVDEPNPLASASLGRIRSGWRQIVRASGACS